MPPDDVFEALSATILYQDLCRNSLRDPAATEPIECIVPCLASAAALARLLPGCRVQIMPEHLIPKLAEPQKRGPKPSGTAMSEAERQRKGRAGTPCRYGARQGTREGIGLTCRTQFPCPIRGKPRDIAHSRACGSNGRGADHRRLRQRLAEEPPPPLKAMFPHLLDTP